MSLASKQTEVKYLKTGKRGMLPYPKGEWAADVTYTATDNVAPYVLRNGTYYVMNKVGSVKGLDPQADYATNGQQATWILLEDYKAVFIELLMARYGLVGKSVFWDDYTFSQEGVDSAGQPSSDYQGFADGSFTPNILIDWVKGTVKLLKLVAEGADVSGTIKAISGQIGDWIIKNGHLSSADFSPYDPSDGSGAGARLSRSGLMVTCSGDESGVIVPSLGAKLAACIVANGKNALVTSSYIGAECTDTYGYLSEVVALELSAKAAYNGITNTPPLAIKVDAGMCDLRGIPALSFGRLNTIYVGTITPNVDVYAYTYPTTKDGTYVFKPSANDQYANCICLTGADTNIYVVNICAPADKGQLIMVLNNTPGKKRVCMTRGSDTWYLDISAYSGKLLATNGAQNSYGGHTVSDLVNLSGG